MKNIFSLLIVSLFSISASASASGYTLNKSVQNGSSVSGQSHSGPGTFENYLVMNLPFSPMKNLFHQVLAVEPRKLINRGEAHITVITPVEFWNVLQPQGISMAEIDEIARSMKIQESDFDVICLGQGSARLNGKVEKTIFVVVESQDLLNIRKEIQNLFISKGGSMDKFDANRFYSHITLGFTSRDLFESDGVTKDSNACIEHIEVRESFGRRDR